MHFINTNTDIAIQFKLGGGGGLGYIKLKDANN